MNCLNFLQYGKTAKYYVYAPGDIDLNILVNRCKEMPRRKEHQGQNSMLLEFLHHDRNISINQIF